MLAKRVSAVEAPVAGIWRLGMRGSWKERARYNQKRSGRCRDQRSSKTVIRSYEFFGRHAVFLRRDFTTGGPAPSRGPRLYFRRSVARVLEHCQRPERGGPRCVPTPIVRGSASCFLAAVPRCGDT